MCCVCVCARNFDTKQSPNMRTKNYDGEKGEEEEEEEGAG